MTRGSILCAALLLGGATASFAQIPGVRSLGSQVYDALTRAEATSSTIGALLRDTINAQQGLCLSVEAYQIFRQTNDAVTVKANCGPQRTYLVSANAAGEVRASGGDGSVALPDPVDGPVVVIDKAEHSIPNDEANTPSGESAEANLITDPEAIARPRGAASAVQLWSMVAAIAALFLAIATFAHAHNKRRTVGGPNRVLPLSSGDKDRLIAEATALHEDLFRHPSGVLIVRGRRGKRRLFPNRLYAELYRRFGIKIAQIR